MNTQLKLSILVFKVVSTKFYFRRNDSDGSNDVMEISVLLHKMKRNRSSPPEVFLGIAALKIFSKFTGEHP